MSKKQPREKIFLTELGTTFREIGAFWYKIPDQPVFAGMKTRFNVPKPFDGIMVYKGQSIAIEAKYMPDYGAFGVQVLTESQRQGLREFCSAGGTSYVFLNIRRKANKEKNLERLNRLLIFKYLELFQYSKSELLQRPYAKGAHGKFDLGIIFETILEGRRLY